MKHIQRIGAIPQGYAACEAEAIEFDKTSIEPSIKLGQVVMEEITNDSNIETPVDN